MKHIIDYIKPCLFSHYTSMVKHSSVEEYILNYYGGKADATIYNFAKDVGPLAAQTLVLFYQDQIQTKVDVMMTDIAFHQTIGLAKNWAIVLSTTDKEKRATLLFAAWKEILPLASQFTFDPDMDEFYPHWYVAQGDDHITSPMEVSTFEEFKTRFNNSVEPHIDEANPIESYEGVDFFEEQFMSKSKEALKRHFSKWGNRVNFFWSEFWEDDQDDHSYGEGCVYVQNCFKGGPGQTPIVAVVK